MKLRITVFREGGGLMTQQWGTVSDPKLYGETVMPAKIWNLIAGGQLSTGLEIETLIVEGKAEAKSEGTRAAAG